MALDPHMDPDLVPGVTGMLVQLLDKLKSLLLMLVDKPPKEHSIDSIWITDTMDTRYGKETNRHLYTVSWRAYEPILIRIDAYGDTGRHTERQT